MLENALIKEVITTLKAGFTAAGYTNVKVVQTNQPTQQGANTGPTVYLTQLPAKRYGFLKRDDRYNQDVDPPVMEHTETQIYETTFQLSALVTQDPKKTTSLTALDVLNMAAAIIQGDKGREYLQSQEIQILRVMDIRNPNFSDDRDRFEYSPSFDFTLTHKQVIISAVPVVESYEANFNRV